MQVDIKFTGESKSNCRQYEIEQIDICNKK